MEKQLQVQQQRLPDVPCPICIVKNDEDFTILYANSPFFKLLGYTEGEVQYKYANKFSALIEIKTLKRLHEALKKEPAVPKIEIEYRVKNGKSSDMWLYSMINLTCLQKENILYITSHDISHYKETEQELFRLRKKTKILFENTTLDVIDYEKNSGRIQEISNSGFFNSQLRHGDIFPDSLIRKDLIHPDYTQVLSESCARIKNGEKRVFTELQLRSAHGEYKWMMLSLCEESYDKGTVISAIFNNITAEKEATINYLNEALFYQAILNTQDAYGHVDVTADKILRIGGLWSFYTELINQITFSSLFEEFVYKVVHIEDRAHYSEIMNCHNITQAYENGITHLSCEFRRIVEQNKMVWMNISLELFENPMDHHIMVLLYLKNIDIQKKQHSLLEYEAGHDALTNLHNKHGAVALIKEYRSLMKEQDQCAFILLNVDDFKLINNKYGYEKGDEILLHISHILSSAFRKYDIIGRFGGDEFLVLVKSIENSGSVENRLNTVINLLEREIEYPVTMSMGIVNVNKADSFEQILLKSQTALKEAKSSGKNRYCLYRESVSDASLDSAALSGINDILEVDVSDRHLDADYIDQFDTFLGKYGEIAYFVDPKTFVLICGNTAFYDRIGATPIECAGKKCYELIHQRTTPCPFCGNSCWTTDRFYMYRNYNEVLDQEFLIKNKLVQWHNSEVLLALAIDLSNDKSSLEVMENLITEDRAIISGIQHMQDAEDIGGVMISGLDAISKFFRADFVQLWILDSETNQYQNSYCYQKEKLDKKTYFSDNEEIIQVSQWLQNRKWIDNFVVQHKEEMLCSSYDLFRRMEKTHTHNQGWFLLADDNDTEIGILEINNISINFQNFSFLRSFSQFIASEWQKRRMLDALIRSGFYDKLTGMLNRASYERFIDGFSETDVTSIGIIFINMDGLKRINEALGFQTGNSYIVQLSEALEQVFPDNEKYRLSGDEFLIAMTNVAQREVELGISKLQDILSDMKLFTVSIGYAWDNVEKEPDVLVEYATQNMKINKARYHASLQTDSNERVELLGWTMGAIEEGRMLVYLQPKVNSLTNEVMGAEALVRYRDKQDGIVPPSKFILPLEKSNLIRYIDFFVFEEVCKIIKRWKAEGKKLPKVSFNFSRITMSENDLITSMETIIEKYGIDKNSVEVEITESYADIGKALLNQAAKNLRRAGYPIALDDFGTKYTNLSILAEIDAQMLKIDKSLVHSVEHDDKARIILKNILQMCKDLNIDVIAEGVETIHQQEILQEMGCYYIQGFLYSKPIAVAAFEDKYL